MVFASIWTAQQREIMSELEKITSVCFFTCIIIMWVAFSFVDLKMLACEYFAKAKPFALENSNSRLNSIIV